MTFRGLFQSLFGKRPNPGTNYPAYRLLSSWDSSFTPFSGRAWDISTVRSAVDAFARNAAKVLPRHIRDTGETRVAPGGNIDSILQIRPNPYMTAFAFYYRVAAQFAVYNNAFIIPFFDNGKLTSLYPINASRIELVEREGLMLARLTFATGSVYTIPYDEIIHLRRHYLDNDIFGDDNRPLNPTLETASSFNQSMSKFAKLVAVIRGVLELSTATKNEDLKSRRDDFIRDNLKMENNGAGVIVTDNRAKYTPITEKVTPLPTGQLDFVTKSIYDYFGVNDAIVQNTATPEEMDAFYTGALSPFYMQLSQGLTNALFTERERAFGSKILCELDRIQFANLEQRTEAATFLTNIGALELDEVRAIFGYAPIGGKEGHRRVQTLNMANTEIVDKYQLDSTGKKDDPPKTKPPENPPKEKNEGGAKPGEEKEE